VPCARLSWPYRQLLSRRKYIVSYRIVCCDVCRQFSDKFRGGRAWRSDVRLSSLRCEVPHPAGPRLYADPCHMQTHQEGPSQQPASADGQRGPGVPHRADRPCRHTVPRVEHTAHPFRLVTRIRPSFIFLVMMEILVLFEGSTNLLT